MVSINGSLDSVVINGIRVDLPTHAADIDAHLYVSDLTLRTGGYMYPFFYGGAAISQTAITVDRIIATPFVVARKMTVDRIAFDTANSDTGKAVRLGIYNNGTNLYPGTLLIDGGATATIESAGTFTVTISQQLTPGLYWLAAVTNGSSVQTRLIISAYTILGVDASPADQASNQTGWTVAQTYGALPNPFTGGGTMLTQHLKLIHLRLLSLD